METPLTTLTQRAAITALINDYVFCIDDGRYEDWPELFVDACRYRIATRESEDRGLPIGILYCSSKGMLLDRVAALRKANIFEPHRYRHLLGPTRFLGTDDDGMHRAVTGFAVIRIMQNGTTDLFLSGQYEDRIQVAEETARFKERAVVLDSKKVDTLIVLPV